MAILTLEATQRKEPINVPSGHGLAGTMKVLCATVELTAADAASTIDFGRVPSNARILPSSRMYNDDCATTGSPTLDFGFKAVNDNITTDPDGLSDGFTLADSADDVLMMSDAADAGNPAWSFVSGQTIDPGGEFILQGQVKDAATNQTGSITIELHYYLD